MPILVIVLCKIGPVFYASILHEKEGTTHVYLPFCGTQAKSLWWSERSRYTPVTFVFFRTLYIHNLQTGKKCCTYLPRIAENVISSNPCRGMDCKESIKRY